MSVGGIGKRGGDFEQPKLDEVERTGNDPAAVRSTGESAETEASRPHVEPTADDILPAHLNDAAASRLEEGLAGKQDGSPPAEGARQRTMAEWNADVDPASTSSFARTRGGGERIGNTRWTRTDTDEAVVAQVGYPRPMTREQVSRDLFGTPEPPPGAILVPRRRAPDDILSRVWDGPIEESRRWDVSMAANPSGGRDVTGQLTPRAYDAIFGEDAPPDAPPRDVLSPQVRQAIDQRQVPPGAREVRPGIHVVEDRGSIVRVDNRQGNYEHQIWTPYEADEREIQRQSLAGQAADDPETHARLQAHTNRQYNFLMRERLSQGMPVQQAHRESVNQLDAEGRQMIAAWAEAMSNGSTPGRVPGRPGATAMERRAQVIETAREPFEQIESALEERRQRRIHGQNP